jgi:Co/Zn/Cd efflux system component
VSAGCRHDHGTCGAEDARVRRILWLALALNGAMFALELGSGLAARSVALQADSLDFLGDAATYAISLSVLALGPIARARAALAKGTSLAVFGVLVAAGTVDQAIHQPLPEAATMGAVGALALAVNVAVAALLFSLRRGEANLRSAWLCSRNDAIGNLAVLAAAAGVFGTGTPWPDIAVGSIMASLALASAVAILRQASAELRLARRPAAAE